MKNPTFCLITVLSVLLFTSGRERESVSSKVACLWKQYIHNCKIIDLEAKPLVYQAHHFYLHLCHNMKEIHL